MLRGQEEALLDHLHDGIDDDDVNEVRATLEDRIEGRSLTMSIGARGGLTLKGSRVPKLLQIAIRCISRACLVKLQRRDYNARSMAGLLVKAAAKHADLRGIVPPRMDVVDEDLDFEHMTIDNANARRSRSRSRSR